MPASHRMEKVNRELAREISRMVAYELNDPRVGFVTVTRVKVSPDLRHAIVFVSTLGTEKERNLVMHGLGHAAGFLHRSLRDRVEGLKHIPQIHFKFDPSIEGAIRIEKKIDEAIQGAKGEFIAEIPEADAGKKIEEEET